MSLVPDPVPLPLVNALFHADVVHPRMKPELDLSPYAFLGNDFWLRYGHFAPPAPPEPATEVIELDVDLARVNALPDESVTSGGIILPEGVR